MKSHISVNFSFIPQITKPLDRVFTTSKQAPPVTGKGVPWTPEGIGALGIIGAIALVLLTGGKKKPKLTTARLAGEKEIANARKIARKQVKKTKKNSFSLWMGSVDTKSPDASCWVPDAQRSIGLVGKPGAGKTVAIRALLESALQQGFAGGIYDKKGEELELFAPLAAQYGYEVAVFAPGELYSMRINPIDALHSPQDATGAAELAKSLLDNTEGDKKGDGFFKDSAVALLKGLFQLSKSTVYPDFGMVYAILSLGSLVDRIEFAVQQEKIDRWIASSFAQIVASKESEKTVASILSTATVMFSRFVEPDILRCIMGPTTVPLRVSGKQLIIFKLNEERRGAVSPIIAAAIEAFVKANFTKARSSPWFLSLDELPSICLPKLVYWINELRSAGACFILGFQFMTQLYDRYGDHLGKAIFGACNHKIIFNPSEKGFAQEQSDSWGQTEVDIKNKSVSHGKDGKSNTLSQQIMQKPLISVDDILGLIPGSCIMTSDAYNDGGRANYPYKTSVKIPRSQFDRWEEAIALWEKSVKSGLISRAKLPSNKQLLSELNDRIKLAESILPLPPSAF